MLKRLLKHVVPEDQSRERFRPYAQSKFKEIYPSNKGIKKAIEKSLFLINGKAATTATIISPGDIIELFREDKNEISPSKITLKIEYEDDHCLIIKKPPGIPVHGHGRHNIVKILAASSIEGSAPDQLIQPLPLHRLDAATGGLLICAKTRSFQVEIGKLFQEKKINKRYTAILIGKLHGEGSFTDDIDGKKALSHFKAIKHWKDSRFKLLSLVHLFPETGRTHQLRIHCANACFPILGERKYTQHLSNLKGKGLFLFADRLSFQHPITSKLIEVGLELPKKFLAEMQSK